MQRVHRHPCEYFLGEVEWRWLEMWCAIHGITELLSIRGLLDKSRPKSSELLLNTIAMVDDDDNAQAEVWVQYDRLPFPDDSIEFIVCAHLLEINDYADAAMSEAVRILKPGGMMIVFGYHRYSLLGLQKFFANDPDQYPPCSSRGGCRRILLDMGLNIVDDHMTTH